MPALPFLPACIHVKLCQPDDADHLSAGSESLEAVCPVSGSSAQPKSHSLLSSPVRSTRAFPALLAQIAEENQGSCKNGGRCNKEFLVWDTWPSLVLSSTHWEDEPR